MKPYNEYTNRQTWIVAKHLEQTEYFDQSFPQDISHGALSKQIQSDISEHCDTGINSDLIENMLACFISHVDFYQLADIHITKTV